MYQNYVFDMYGTLVDVRTAEDSYDVFRKLAKFYGFRGAEYEAAELKTAFKELVGKAEQALQGGKSEKTGEKITWPEIDVVPVFQKLFEIKNIEVSRQEAEITANWFRITATRKLKVYPGVFELLQTLKKRGKGVYLLSNAQRAYTAGELKTTGLEKWFDGILLSSDYQCRKPDPAFFRALFRQYDFKPEEALMVGNDMHSDIRGANLTGMDSLLLATDAGLAEPIDGISSTYTVKDGDFRKIREIPGVL